MRVCLTTILTVVSLFLAPTGSFGNSNKIRQIAASLSAEEIDVFRKWATSHGRLVNDFQSKPERRVQQAIQSLENFLKVRIQNHPDYNKYHWKILVYHSEEANAFAYLTTPEAGEESEWLRANFNQTWPIRKALEIADNKPIAFIGLTTEILKKLKKKGQLAFVMGHEAKHIFDRHGVVGPGLATRVKTWIDTQGKEVVADLGSLEFMLGHDRLEYGLEALDMFNEDVEPKSDLSKHLEQAAKASAQVHHHPTVRQSMVQARAAFLNRHDRRAIQTPSEDIPELWKTIARKPLESPVFGDNFLLKYSEVLDEVKGLPENSPFEKYFNLFYRKLKDANVEGLKDSALVVGRFLDLVSSSGLPDHKKALITTAFMVEQMEFNSWQKYFATISKSEVLRWRRLLSGLSSSSIELGVFDRTGDYLKPRVVLLEMFERGSFANQVGDSLIASKPIWFELTHKKLLEEKLDVIFPTGQRPYFNKIVEALGHTRTGIDHRGTVHREIVTRIVERFEVTPFESLLIREEGRFAYSDSEKFSYFVTWLRVFRKIYESENQQLLMQANLDQTVNRIWEKYRGTIKQKMFDKMNEIVSASDSESFVPTLDHMGEGLSILQSLDNQLVDDREFRRLLVELVNKFSNGSAKEALAICRFGIWNNIDEKLVHRLILNILSDPSFSAEARFQAVFGLVWGVRQPMDEILKNNPSIRAYMRLVLQNMNAHQPEVIKDLLLEKEWNKEFKRIPSTGKLGRDELPGLFMFQDYQMTLVQTIMATGLMPKLTDELASLLIQEMKWGLENISRTGIDYMNSEYRSPAKGIEILVDWILFKASKSTNPRDHLEWFIKLEEILKVAGKNFIFSGSQKAIAGAAASNSLKLFSKVQLKKALKRPSVKLALNEEQYAEKVIEYINYITPPEKGKALLSATLAQFETELNFKDLNSEIRNLVHNRLAEQYQIQPLEVSNIFPQDTRNETQKYENKHALVRGLSLVVSFLENRSPKEQLQAIEYLMGRMRNPPPVVNLIQNELNKKQIRAEVSDYLASIRSRLSAATVMERMLAINSLLAGQNSFLNSKNGTSHILNFISEKLPVDQAKIVKDFGGAVIKAEGRDASLFVSYVLAQKDKNPDNSNLGIELLIKGILDFYGVPGWKLAQYLGFSGEFKQFESALSSYQDAAFPPEYIGILIYLRDYYKEKFDFEKAKIIKILGTGSVNIAIEYLDLPDNQIKVINIPRKNIKIQTQKDFQRFRKFMDELLKLPGSEKYQFLAGLLGTIEKSVNLEFDRTMVLQRQREAVEIYNSKSKGWKIRTVQTYGSIDDLILLEKAYGLGATKVIKNDHQLYKSAMGALYNFEFEHLRGNLDTSDQGTVHLANPDLHDGQVFIDRETQTVTVIDFGQAVPIDSKQRALGIDILAFIGGLISAKSYQQKLLAYRSVLGFSRVISTESLNELKTKSDPMDRFVHLIALHSQAGIELPLATVHWIFGMNRLRVLGKKIDLRPDITIGSLVFGKMVKDAGKNILQKTKSYGKKNGIKNSCEIFYF